MPSNHCAEVITLNKKERSLALLCWVAYFLGIPLLLGMFPTLTGEDQRSQFLYNLAFYVVSFSLLLMVFRNFLYRSKMPLGILFVASFFGLLATYGLSNLFGSILHAVVYALSLERENLNQVAVEAYMEAYRFPMLLNIVILAPVVEEILFRGTIFGPLCKKNTFLAYAASMSLFSAMHILSFIGHQSYVELLISFLEYLPAGFTLCFCYHRYHSIWVPIAVHGLMNLLSSLLIV